MTVAEDDLEHEVLALRAAGEPGRAVTRAVQALGPELLGYLRAFLRDDDAADEAFAMACEDLWRGLPSFRGESTFRTWAYRLTWHAAMRLLRDPFRRRGERLPTDPQIAELVRTTTALYTRQASKDLLADLRATLSPEDRTLLILRIDRGFTWPQVARVMAEDGGDVSEAALRKRFERLKDRLRDEARARGLLPG